MEVGGQGLRWLWHRDARAGSCISLSRRHTSISLQQRHTSGRKEREGDTDRGQMVGVAMLTYQRLAFCLLPYTHKQTYTHTR